MKFQFEAHSTALKECQEKFTATAYFLIMKEGDDR